MDYSDIINLPHHVSKVHPRMSMYQRAAQFAPFAALTGHDAAIRETARLTDSQIEPTPNRGQLSSLELPRCEGGRLISQLGDENTEILNRRMSLIRDHLKETPEIIVTFFQPDEKKTGGSYETYTGYIKDIDDYEQQLVMTDGMKIALPAVFDIDSKLFDNEEI